MVDYDYDSGLSRYIHNGKTLFKIISPLTYPLHLTRYQLFKLRQKAKLAAEEAERMKEERSQSLVKVVKRKKIQG